MAAAAAANSFHSTSPDHSTRCSVRRMRSSLPYFPLRLPSPARLYFPSLSLSSTPCRSLSPVRSGGSGGGSGDGGGYGGGGGNDDHDDDGAGGRNRREALLVLDGIGRSMDTLPSDLAGAIKAGKLPAEVVRRFVELDSSPMLRWLMRFAGFRERLLADDLFLAKVAMECGVGVFTKTMAEWERRREKFFREIDFVIADVVMAIIADFMLVWLPAPTISLRSPLPFGAGIISKFFASCPDNAFQVALSGTSYSLLQRFGSILRNGFKLLAVGTGASLIGTIITNALIKSRSVFSSESISEIEDVPIFGTSLAYGVYMAVSSNLRYQFLAGVVEQRIFEPLLHDQKLLLSAFSFAVRTGNTFLGSLLWVDYARFVGVQAIQE